MNIVKSVAKAISDFDLIQKDDRILIGASGGKDSLTLSYVLAQLQNWKHYSFTLTAVHVLTSDSNEHPTLSNLYKMIGIPLVVLNEPLSMEEQKNRTCYTCATHRRVALMKYARNHNFNKIALGHHLDDALTTLLMNLLLQGSIDVLEAKRYYEPFKVTLIRPLMYTPEESIIRFTRDQGWNSVTCTCSKGTHGTRADYRKRLEMLTGGSLSEKRRMFSAFLPTLKT
jgi:tRNA 2-thiocytidine biosynthesis protein TtcA